MDSRESDTLIQRLVQNPHDEHALARAHQAGSVDPRAYALLLEKVGMTTTDPAYAAHWLSEAANVWSMTIGDLHHAARTLMIAIDKDPTSTTAADRLAQLYREKGDQRALAALLERMVKSLGPLVIQRPELRASVIGMHEELGKLWVSPPLSKPERAVENWKRVTDLDRENIMAIYQAREILKAQENFAEAVPYFAMEQKLVDDVDRKLALYRDESAVRVRAGDGVGASDALRRARALRPDDYGLAQELGTSIVTRIEGGERVGDAEREEARALFVSLAETYDGEYGFHYAVSALKATPGDDRAMQLADHYGKQIGKTNELSPQYGAYVVANPNGFMAAEARSRAGALPPAPRTKSAPPQGGASPGAPPHRGPIPEATPSEPEMLADDDGDEAEPGVPGAVNPAEVRALLDQAQTEAQKGRKPTALQKFREALKLDPSNAEALSWVEEHLRQKRMYADLRDVLLAASRVVTQPLETRKAQLRDVAGLCEAQLRDLDTAITASKQVVQMDRGDEQAREQLRRLLEKGSRWDDLASVIEQEAMSVPDVETKIALEKKLATLHETKRKDTGAAAEAWARIAQLSPGDEAAIQTAVKLFEKGELFDLAAQVIADNVSGIEDKASRGGFLSRLGDLKNKAGDRGAAGDAFAEAADIYGPDGGSQTGKLWEQAELAYTKAERFTDAANAVEQRANLVDGKEKAALLATAAALFEQSGDIPTAIEKLEQSAALDPTHPETTGKLEALYRSADRLGDLATFLTSLAEKIQDKETRVATRFKTAEVQRALGDADGARETLLLVLNDGDDARALTELIADAESRQDHQEGADLTRRLADITGDKAEKLRLSLKEASLYANEMDDPPAAIERYEAVLKNFSPSGADERNALASIVELHAKLGDERATADALERSLAITHDGEKAEVAQRLAQLYEGPLDDPKAAIRALEIVHASDPEDFDAVARLLRLSETTENWDRVAALLGMLIEVEGDEHEASEMSRKLSRIQHVELKRGDEALATLERLADQGDKPCQDAYVILGDVLGWQGIVATKLVMWNEQGSGPTRNEALRGAFDRFLAIGREADASRVAMELAKSRAADRELGEKLEPVAINMKDLDALSAAHEILARDLSGIERATELVRQAEVKVEAGADPIEAIQHGESALSSVPPSEVEPLLARLAILTAAPGHVIDIYERQVGRCKQPADRLAALGRAAQVASVRGAPERVRSFFEIALGAGAQEETLSLLEDVANRGDAETGTGTLRTILAEALAAGGQGSRDGGRTRAALLRRASVIAERDLGDLDKAFGWIGDSLITHVDDAALAALDELGARANDKRRVEATLARALEEVFDGPLVRKLLARRARLRRDELGDKPGAATDLKKLHDLSPSDQEVMNELSALLEALGDHRGMINLYEDQILRGRDPAQRAELARKVARLWEEEIGDAREAADAWRRVLRMKAADPEATTGLERAKAGNLKKAPPVYEGAGNASSPPVNRPPSTRPVASPTSSEMAGEVTSDGQEEVTPVGDRLVPNSGPPSGPTSSGPPTDSGNATANHLAYPASTGAPGFTESHPALSPAAASNEGIEPGAVWPSAAHTEAYPPSDPYAGYGTAPAAPDTNVGVGHPEYHGGEPPMPAAHGEGGYPAPAGYGEGGYAQGYPPQGGYAAPYPQHDGVAPAAAPPNGWVESPPTDPAHHGFPSPTTDNEAHDDAVEDVDEAELIDDEDPKHRK